MWLRSPLVNWVKLDPLVTALGFGCMGLSGAYAYGLQKPDAERFVLLDKCYEVGARNWDTADAYRDNEDLIGNWFAANPDKRQDIFLATKFANKPKPGGGYERLGLSYVDLYYCHHLNGKTPVEQTVRAMAELKEEGKIKYLGLSECSAESLRRPYKVHPISAVQVEYSPFALDMESPQIDLLTTCRNLGVAVVAYSPIGRGMLSSTIRSPENFGEGDSRGMRPRFSKENFPKNLELMDRIGALAEKTRVTATQLTLAWIMNQGGNIIPIPGTTKIEKLVESMGSVEVQLSDEEDKEIRQACEACEVHGERYPAMFQAALFADTPEE
ncbi:voltage-gated shaker-like K+ channel, subunit [Aulographum hederae CBS 113979]|uniref:Voltage-gated shaker-like K+ channel, subunit n=1 Tax=Aulographum hederae CBS 113979 TaxID=1176131 RepID=A0A6G1H7P2_9PEZI|nr:voltage-gated shaker-like K+ channel, subunit [Aulographum hederae CBS 113979]